MSFNSSIILSLYSSSCSGLSSNSSTFAIASFCAFVNLFPSNMNSEAFSSSIFFNSSACFCSGVFLGLGGSLPFFSSYIPQAFSVAFIRSSACFSFTSSIRDFGTISVFKMFPPYLSNELTSFSKFSIHLISSD